MYGFTKTAAAELGRYGIRIHAICPNAYTRMTANLPGFAEANGLPADFRLYAASGSPLLFKRIDRERGRQP